MKSALLIVDMQRQFKGVTPETDVILEAAVEYINAASALFREKKLPVFLVYDVDEEGGRVPGKDCFEMLPSIVTSDTDVRIHKTKGNAFKDTDLAAKLRTLGVDTVIVTGFCAEYCVLSTVRGAADDGFSSMLLRGSLATRTPERVKFVEDVSDVISYGALCALL